MANLPANVHVSKHPCVAAKVSKLRSSSTVNAREVQALVHEISLIVATEALGETLEVIESGIDTSVLGYEYAYKTVSPDQISLMPILRSGLGMVDAVQTLMPERLPVHHLGLYRDKTTGNAVEYYRNTHGETPYERTILVDPVIATGTTACAAIETLQDWGVNSIVMINIIASIEGLRRAAEYWPEGVEIWVGAVDEEVDSAGMLKPGLGDIGDRLFLALGR